MIKISSNFRQVGGVAGEALFVYRIQEDVHTSSNYNSPEFIPGLEIFGLVHS